MRRLVLVLALLALAGGRLACRRKRACPGPEHALELPGPTEADRRRDADFDAIFDRVMAGDRICARER